nr:hypothetical protein B0A51_10205 [Rachicladosporium sp. CCFEE 5018]
MGLPRSANCGLDQQQYPSQFRYNEIAAALSIFFLIIVSLVLLWNIYHRLRQIFTQRQLIGSTGARQKEPILAVSPLSALLASVIGIVLIFGTWPQPLQGAGLLVIVLAQVSVLGSQDHSLKWKNLIDRVLEVLAVIVTAYGLQDAGNKYTETYGNGFYTWHDPSRSAETAYGLIGSGFLICVVQQVLVTRSQWARHRRLVLKVCSALFVGVQTATFILAAYIGAHAIPDGCVVFNATKVTALVASGLSLAYSIAIAVWRSCAVST